MPPKLTVKSNVIAIFKVSFLIISLKYKRHIPCERYMSYEYFPSLDATELFLHTKTRDIKTTNIENTSELTMLNVTGIPL